MGSVCESNNSNEGHRWYNTYSGLVWGLGLFSVFLVHGWDRIKTSKCLSLLGFKYPYICTIIGTLRGVGHYTSLNRSY